MQRAILESPFKGSDGWSSTAKNVAYARCAVRESILEGRAPSASHVIYTQNGIVNDMDKGERKFGINGGLALGQACWVSTVFCGVGISAGMEEGIRRAQAEGRPIEMRHDALENLNVSEDLIQGVAGELAMGPFPGLPATMNYDAFDNWQDIKVTVVLTPYDGLKETDHIALAEDIAYARLALRDTLTNHCEAAFAERLMYGQPGVMDYANEEERILAGVAGWAWRRKADILAVYTDRTITKQMRQIIAQAIEDGKEVEWRELPKDLKQVMPALTNVVRQEMACYVKSR